MFGHIFINRLKCIIRDKALIFWTLVFPLILATFFNMSIGNIDKASEFKAISIGVVSNEAYNLDEAFKTTLASASQGEKKLFELHTGTKEEMDKMLDDNKITAYLIEEDSIEMVVRKSGFNQTIVKTFLDEYTQTSGTIKKILSGSSAINIQELLEKAGNRKSIIRDIPIGKKSNPSQTVTYFYSLIAMSCMYGSYFGLKEITDIQADLSTRAARVNVSPANKLKMVLGGLSAAFIIQYLEIMALMAYVVFVLKVDFGNQLGYILLTCLVGCMAGLTFGSFVSAAVKKKEGIKTAILIGGTMAASFLAGMMVGQMKYIIQRNVPLLSYINPVALITDAFYALYFFDSHSRFFLNIGLLCCFTLIFGAITYLVIRRHKYESL